MYAIDKDIVVDLTEIPLSDSGAPAPALFVNESRVLLAYFISPTDDGQIAYLEFLNCRAHYFGAPNDETLHGHPLYKRGLKHYAIAEVRNSSWLRSLE